MAAAHPKGTFATFALLAAAACGAPPVPRVRAAAKPPPPALLAPSADAGVAAGGDAEDARVVSRADGAPGMGWPSMSWLDEQRLLLEGSDVRVLDVVTRVATVLAPGPGGLVQESADRSRLLVTGSAAAELWSVSPLARVGSFPCATGTATFEARSTRVVCAGADAPRSPVPVMELDEETLPALAKRLASVRRVRVTDDVVSNADGGEAIVAVRGLPPEVGDDGRWLMFRLGANGRTVLRVGALAPRSVECAGSLDYVIDPALPRLYGTKGVGHLCVIDLATGRKTEHGAPPPPRKADCCGSPHLTVLGDGMLLSGGGFAWTTVVDAKTGAQVTIPGYGELGGLDYVRTDTLLVVVSDAQGGELVAIEPRARTLAWRRHRAFERPGEAPTVTVSPSGKRLAVLARDGATEPRVFDVATGRPLSPPDAVDAASFASDGGLLVRVASGAVQRWDLRSGAVVAVATFAEAATSAAARARGRERCEVAGGAAFLAAREDGALTACLRRERIVLVRESGPLDAALEPRPALGGAIVWADDGAVDLLGDEAALSAALGCARGDAVLPFTACSAKARRPGLLAASLRARD